MTQRDSPDEPPSRRFGAKQLLVLSVLLTLWGCSRATTPPVEIRTGDPFRPELLRGVGTLAVLPAVGVGSAEELAPGALERMTLVVEAALAADPDWKRADPERVQQAVAEISGSDPLEVRAGQLAARVAADGALAIRVRRFRDRIGSSYGADRPAAVSLELVLVLPEQRQAAWSATYGVEQQPVSYNLFELWTVTRGGVRWHTADELARIGIDEALDRLAKLRPPATDGPSES